MIVEIVFPVASLSLSVCVQEMRVAMPSGICMLFYDGLQKRLKGLAG